MKSQPQPKHLVIDEQDLLNVMSIQNDNVYLSQIPLSKDNVYLPLQQNDLDEKFYPYSRSCNDFLYCFRTISFS